MYEELISIVNQLKNKSKCEKMTFVMSCEPSSQIKNFIEENGHTYYVIENSNVLESNTIYIMPNYPIDYMPFEVIE